jgi:hypothetical protein
VGHLGLTLAGCTIEIEKEITKAAVIYFFPISRIERK